MRRAMALVAVVVLATACGGGTTDQAEAISGGAADSTVAVPVTTASTMATTTTELPPDTTVAEPTITRDELDSGLPVSGTYGPLEVSVQAATIANIVPRTFTDEPEADEATWLFLDLRVTNTSASIDLLMGDLAWGITIDGEAQQPPEQVDGMRTVIVSANASEETLVAFEVPEGTTFDQVSLTATEPDRIPTVIPLTTPAEPSEYPVEIDVTGSGPAEGSGTGCRHLFDVDVRGATAAVDSPLMDLSVTTNYGSFRANAGERFLAMDVVMLNAGPGSSCGGSTSNLDNGDFRIVIDGVPKEPVNWTAEQVDRDTAYEGVILFAVPLDTIEVEFQVGSSDATLFTLPVPWEELPAAQGE